MIDRLAVDELRWDGGAVGEVPLVEVAVLEGTGEAG